MLTLKSRLALAGGGLAALIIVPALFMAYARADTASAWLSPANLTLQKQADLSVVPPAINGNEDCFPEDNAVCAISTPYGSANTTGAVKLSQGGSYYPVVSYIDARQHFIAIPNSNTVMTYTTEPPYGFYIYYNYNFSSSITPINNGLGTYYQINRPPDGKLADKTGQRLAADYTSISFSENGEWMVVSEPNVAMLRVNLHTFEVLPFAPGFNYTIGLNPNPQTAITNDGRYAVVASKDFSRFDVYDLSTCAAVADTFTGPAACQSRDMQALVQSQVPGYINASNLRFISDDTLGLYASYTNVAAHKTAKYILSTAGGIIHQQDYLALGDSYISGEGGFEYLLGTDTSDNQCHVSQVSYPYLLGQELSYNAYHSVACSGATTSDILDASSKYTGQTVSRVTRDKRDIPAILSNFQQGYIDQLDFVKQYQPKVITLSVGGNDIGFSARLRGCLDASTCYSTYEDRLEFVREVNAAFPKLVNTYTKIKSAGAADARIYVIGYPQIALPGGNCAANVHMDKNELEFAEQAISYLDAVLSQAAAKAGVFFVDTQDAFFGHRLCEAGPGSVAMNGITAGNDFPDKFNGPIGRESYHPNAFGYQLLENKILIATHNLTYAMPEPDLAAKPPAETDQDILNAPHSGRPVNATEYDPNLLDDLAYRDVPTDVSIDGTAYALAPGTALQAQVHSTPLTLGAYTTDANGNLSAQITIPASVPAGYHTVHFYGTDISGQPVDIYKIIYVASTADDLDGDGTADSAQVCIGVPAAGQDVDQDGADDACDGIIGQPPATASSAAPTAAQVSVRLSASAVTPPAGQGRASSGQVITEQTNNLAAFKNSGAKVLGAKTTKLAALKADYDDNLRIPANYLVIPGAVVPAVTALAFLAKRWIG